MVTDESECADDSSDAVVIGPPVLVSDQTCDDSKEEKLVAVMEKQVTKRKEGEMSHYRYICYLLFSHYFVVF